MTSAFKVRCNQFQCIYIYDDTAGSHYDATLAAQQGNLFSKECYNGNSLPHIMEFVKSSSHVAGNNFPGIASQFAMHFFFI